MPVAVMFLMMCRQYLQYCFRRFRKIWSISIQSILSDAKQISVSQKNVMRLERRTNVYETIRNDTNVYERNTNVERTLNERSLNRKEKIENRKDNKDKSLIEKTISFSDDARMNEAITRWLAYKKERGQTYKPTGLKAFITRLGNLSGGNGEVALKMVEQSMANNYSGVFPLNNNRVVTNTPDMGVVLQDSNNKDYSKGGW